MLKIIESKKVNGYKVWLIKLNDELYQIKVNADTVLEVANLGDGLLWFGRFESHMGTMPYYHKENI